MKLLVVLAVACSCAAQVILPYSAVAPWATTYTTGAGFGHYGWGQTQHQMRFPDGSVLGSYSHIDANGEPVITTYKAGAGIGYVVTGSNALPEAPVDTPEVAKAKAEFQAAFDAASAAATAEAPAEAPADARRKRREVTVPLPYLHAVPAVAKHTYKTKHLEPAADAATPAATSKLEIITKEHEISVPTVKYVQPTLKYKPVTYSAVSPFPYAGFPYGHLPLHTVKIE